MLLYNNLIPGHCRYGGGPSCAHPPGPLSYSQPQQQRALDGGGATGLAKQASPLNCAAPPQPPISTTVNNGSFDVKVVRISEPDDDFSLADSGCDDYLSTGGQRHAEDDDELYYRPFCHSNVESDRGGRRKCCGFNPSSGENENKSKITDGRFATQNQSKDLLAMLLGEEAAIHTSSVDDYGGDIASLIREASDQSQKARCMTDALATKKRCIDHGCKRVHAGHFAARGRNKMLEKGTSKTQGGCLFDSGNNADLESKTDRVDENNDDLFYAVTSAIHAEAARSYRRVYCTLIGTQMPSMSSPLASSSDASLTDGMFRERRCQGQLLGGLGNGNNGDKFFDFTSFELAKSMIVLSDMHARTATMLCSMGLKWNCDCTALSTTSTTTAVNVAQDNGMSVAATTRPVGTYSSFASATVAINQPNSSLPSHNSGNFRSNTLPGTKLHHKRLRLAVRKALDTANHEEDITNSTFLGRPVGGGAHQSLISSKVTWSKNSLRDSGSRGRGDKLQYRADIDEVNPVDDLMKLEKELKIMETKLEMGNSVSNLGFGYRPDGSFCVVPPGSSYMASSIMWTSGILLPGNQRQNSRLKSNNSNVQQYQHGIVGVRSRANHLQHFLGGGNHSRGMTAPTATKIIPTPSEIHLREGLQIVSPGNNIALDQSWWGAGGGQASLLTSSVTLSVAAIATTASTSLPQCHHALQHPQPVKDHSNDADTSKSDVISALARNKLVPSTSTNEKQLMQLMDSLNRLGNENAQLMRMVDDCKIARAEAHAAREMMSNFKSEYGQRFEKVKEALMKFNSSSGGNSGGGGPRDNCNPVANSAFIKSATIIEVHKRDLMIKQLSNDLKKEREECKRKDSALQKYEAFYREVKARSAEKARLRQQQEKRLS